VATSDQARNGRFVPAMNTDAWRVGARRAFAWAIPLTALAMLALMLVPADAWRQPTDDAVYSGFDPNLIYVNARGDATADGVVRVQTESLQLTALPDSQPTVHLVTSPLSFRAAMDVRVLEGDAATTPFQMAIWSARNGSGYILEFGPPPENLVRARVIVNGTAAQTLMGGTTIKSEALGRYAPGQLYHLEMVLDKRSGVIYSLLSGREAPPNDAPMLRLVGGPADPAYREVISTPVRVEAGKRYRFGGFVKRVTGVDAYKIALQWLDRSENPLGFANDWRSVQELEGWTQREFSGVAPPEAAGARVLLGSGNGTQLLFAGVFVHEDRRPGKNLLPNGSFRRGADNWEIAGRPAQPPQIISQHTPLMESSVTVEEAPALLGSLRLSLTAAAASKAGIARTVMQDYRLTIPHQRWQAVRVEDALARGMVVVLLGLGALLCLIRLWMWARPAWQRAIAGQGLGVQPLIVPLSATSLAVAIAVAAYALINAALINLGSHPFDMTAAKVWTYVAATRGPVALHYLPHTVTLAKVWGGAPYHEAVFPYHPAMTYYVTFLGWIYKTFLSGPGPLSADTFQLEVLIKGSNVLFGFGDAVLLYLILRRWNVSHTWARAAGALFLLNPAVWFSTSVWGQNHIVTLFPLLAAIWLAETHRPTGAWLALLTGALTRPQTLVPAFLLGLVFLRRFSLKENAGGIAWSIVVAFVVFGPLALAIGPSLWVDTLAYQLFVQEAGGNEAAMTIVSLDAYNVWSLVTRAAEAATGLGRFQFSSSTPLLGSLTYLRISQILVLTVILGVGLCVLLWRRSDAGARGYVPLIAAGTAGFLMLKTGLAASHFIIALPFLLLSLPTQGRRAWLLMVGVWTLTTLASMYGSLGFGIWDAASLAPALHDTRNAATRLFMNLHAADWFITAAAVANTIVVGWLGIAAVRRHGYAAGSPAGSR